MTLISCSHNEQRAEEPTSTPTSYLELSQISPSQTASALPGIIDCIGNPLEGPSVVHLSCTEQSNVLAGISWDLWDNNSAHGTGTGPGGTTHEITLAHPVILPSGFYVFSSMLIDGSPNTP
ncbi:MAG: hypothetical protein Q3962_00485 [Corynebacterium sp.]|nr:hypothetical protein [Corynebacterium sp.]